MKRPAFAVSFPPTPHGIGVGWLRATGILIVCSQLLQHGFPITSWLEGWLHWLDVLLALCLVSDLVVALLLLDDKRQVLVARRFELVLLGIFGILLAISSWLAADVGQRIAEFLHLASARELKWNLLGLFLLLSLCIQLLRGGQRLVGRTTRPEIVLAASFAGLILLGTLLLLLPNSSADPSNPISLMEAFFTATSAACTTGLVVRDIGADFSRFGHLVVLGLVQVGGVGVITFVGLLSVLSARSLPIRQLLVFRQIVFAPALSDLKKQVVGIVVVTATIELAGAFLIYSFLPDRGDQLDRIRWSVFHSVSSFCQAGLALEPNSLERYGANPGIMITFMGLIVLGGLGFIVIMDLLSYRFTRSRVFRRIGFFRRIHAGQAPERLSVQTKIALTGTAALLVGGFVGFALLEGGHALLDRPFSEGILAAAFQSVTPRTAGFNTVPIGELRDATLIFLMMLMVIGANPVSAGGGIKTVSFGILLLALRSMIARRDRVEAFGRTIPVRTLFAALSIFVIYILSASLGIFLLAIFDPDMALQDQSFEVISALSTVGLSTGITADLSVPSQLVLCAAMFLGRIGPISLVLSVFQSRHSTNYEYPGEEVIVG